MTTVASNRRYRSPPSRREFIGLREDAARMLLELSVAAMTPITVISQLLVGSASVRFIVLCAAAAALPGAAILARTPFRHPAAAVSLIIVVSITIDGCVGVGLLWAHWFHPAVAALIVGTVSSLRLLQVVIVQALNRDRGQPLRRSSLNGPVPRAAALEPGLEAGAVVGAQRFQPAAVVLSLGPLLVGTALWIMSLHSIHLNRVFVNSGLLSQAPAIWYVGLAVLTFGCLREVWLTQNGWFVGAYLGALTLVILGTIPALADAPQYSWVYKHIAITALLVSRGSVSPSIDIYNRFPGMFALAAELTKISGLSPIQYANWVQVVFTWLTLLLVYAISFTVTSNRRIACMAALLFLCANWIGQIYFSPQTLGYVLFLGFMLLALGELGRPRHSPIVTRITGWLGSRFHGVLARWFPPDTRPLAPEPLISVRLVAPLLLLIDFFLVATHQLTPYMLLIAFGLLVFTRSVRGVWLWVACVVITLGYLVPNIAWINHQYGLLNSFSLTNLTGVAVFGLPQYRDPLYGDAGGQVVISMLGVMVVACFLLLRRGHVQKMSLLLIMAAAPAVILAGQDYGGEGPLRVFLFSLPWQVTLIGLAAEGVRRWVGVAVMTLITVVMLTLTLLTTLGNAGESVIPRGELQAALYINAHLRTGAALITVGGGFPTKVGSRYADFARAVVDDAPDLFNDEPRLARNLSPFQTALQVKGEILGYAKYGVVVFSKTQNVYSQLEHVVPIARLRAIEADVAASPDFKLWYSNSTTQIYELQKSRVFGG